MEKVTFLKGKKTILRPLEEADLYKCQKWINDPEIRKLVLNPFPVNLIKEKKWIEEQSYKSNDFIFSIETMDREFIGTMGLHEINWIHRIGTTGALIGEKKYWGKGYGSDAKMQLLNYAFNTLNLRKICSSVIEFNKRSLNYSLKCGYKKEGCRKKQIFKNGQYWDEILLAVFKKDWITLWNKND